MNGWIKLYRSIKDHWIYKNPDYLKAWIAILLEVNHSDKKVLIKNSLMDCRRGESLNSVKKWVEVFGDEWTSQKVRTFFKLLKSDSMINIQTTSQTTKLTVCNYGTYQDEQQTANTDSNKQLTNSQQTANKQLTTNNNDKKENNEEEIYISFADAARKLFAKKDKIELCPKFIDYWTTKSQFDDTMRFKSTEFFSITTAVTNWIENDNDRRGNKKETITVQKAEGFE